MMYGSYYTLLSRMALLALESQQVMALRMVRLASGGALASREWQRMLMEKSLAAQQIGLASAVSLAAGKSNSAIAGNAVRSFRTRVNKNRRRLRSR
jgi:hypothetical protein